VCPTKRQRSFSGKTNFCVTYLRLMRDYLDQCHTELNYYEAKRCKDRMNQISQIEYMR